MDKESLRKASAWRVATELVIMAADARETGRWANGAEVLGQAAQDLIEHAAKPEERRERIILQNLNWLLKPKP